MNADLQLTSPSFTHAELVLRAARWLANRQNCRLVLRETYASTGECPDAIGWKYGDRSYLVEVKVSRADFIADREKPFRKNPARGAGWARYMMVPAGLLTVADMDGLQGWGLLLVAGRSVREVIKAQPQSAINREAEVSLLVQALANAQLCAGRDLNDWFSDPESAVGRLRAKRRSINDRQRQQDREKQCGGNYDPMTRCVTYCQALVATGYSHCSEHGGRTRGETRKQQVVAEAHRSALTSARKAGAL